MRRVIDKDFIFKLAKSMRAHADEARELYTRKAVRSGIPLYMVEGVVGYLVDGCPTGDFLRNVISNDLVGAFTHADDTNATQLKAYANLLYNVFPRGIWGSEDHYSAWINAHDVLMDEEQASSSSSSS